MMTTRSRMNPHTFALQAWSEHTKMRLLIVGFPRGGGGWGGGPPAEHDDGGGARCTAESLRIAANAVRGLVLFGNFSLSLRTSSKRSLINSPAKHLLLAHFCWFPHFPEPAVAAEWIRNCRRGAFFQRAPREVGLLLSVHCFGCLRFIDTIMSPRRTHARASD